MIRSRKTIPGSRFPCTSTIRLKTSCAAVRQWEPGAGVDERICGISVHCLHEFFRKSYGDIEVSDLFVVGLALINSRISGWSTLRMPMFAPRLVPPCLIASVAALKVFKTKGPLATHQWSGPHRTWSQARKTKAGPAPRLLDQGCILKGLKDAFHRIFDGQNKTGR